MLTCDIPMTHHHDSRQAIKDFSLKGYGVGEASQEACQENHWQSFKLEKEITAPYWRVYMHNNQGHPKYMTVLEVRFFGRLSD